MRLRCSILYRMALAALAVVDVIVTILLVTLGYILGSSLGFFIAGLTAALTAVGLWMVYRDLARMARTVIRVEDSVGKVSCYRLGEALLWEEGGGFACYSPPYNRLAKARLGEVLETRVPGITGPGFVCATPLEVEEVQFSGGRSGYRVKGVIAVLTPEGKIAVGRGELDYVGEPGDEDLRPNSRRASSSAASV
ncbi:hypothetical protein ACAM_0122 [Aeropyrum camini SY1 = JCM 12091]|uniref:Uncharacterized protein n=1 Tax=Aeropyrum camini SY1 = JCM 12091 TaxID=1198449 RepID=U3TAY9_9CREN|nr:hypothetical protein ACAM_0122 [Aeropyrum camini SY1 = JCM 12091]